MATEQRAASEATVRAPGDTRPVEKRWLYRLGPRALVGFALVSLLVAWLMTTPPWGAPDEDSHYLRALTLTNGALVGPKVPYHLPGLRITRTSSSYVGDWGTITPAPKAVLQEQAWANHDTRAVHVPAKLSPPGDTCLDGRPDITIAGCSEATPTGDYFPLAYLLPAAALRVAPDATTGDWLARIASLIPVVVFLLVAVALVSPLGPWALLGLLVAVTPMVLFVGSVLNPNGLDIAASLACAAAALRIAVERDRASGWIWIALVVAGWWPSYRGN